MAWPAWLYENFPSVQSTAQERKVQERVGPEKAEQLLQPIAAPSLSPLSTSSEASLSLPLLTLVTPR